MYLGRDSEAWGIAELIEPNSVIPWPGYIVLLNEGEYGHLAVILGIEGSNLRIIEANYVECRVTQRILDVSSPLIRGYFNP